MSYWCCAHTIRDWVKIISPPTTNITPSLMTHRELCEERSEKLNETEQWGEPWGRPPCCWSVWLALKLQVWDSPELCFMIYVFLISFKMYPFSFSCFLISHCINWEINVGSGIQIRKKLLSNSSQQCLWRVKGLGTCETILQLMSISEV